MNKHSLNRFIDKYYLGGNCSSVVIKSDGDMLSPRFITGDKNLLGELKMKDWTQIVFPVLALIMLLQHVAVSFIITKIFPGEETYELIFAAMKNVCNCVYSCCYYDNYY